MKDELEELWKATVVGYFKVKSQNLFRGKEAIMKS
jgi:hypothetical protein